MPQSLVLFLLAPIVMAPKSEPRLPQYFGSDFMYLVTSRYCGTNRPGGDIGLTSISNYMEILFITDYSVQVVGFQVRMMT